MYRAEGIGLAAPPNWFAAAAAPALKSVLIFIPP
jgi:hypothetical protein